MPPLPTRRVAVRAIDTNVIVRFLTGDDPEQAEKSRRLIGEGALFVPTSVLLESEWVLRSAYDFSGIEVVQALRAFCGLPGVTLEDTPLAARALDWAEQGMDFADALHLGRAEDCSAFMSFDRKLARTADALGMAKVVQP